MYWPPEVGTTMEFRSMIVSNNGYTVDSKNKNIYIRELELSNEDDEYVRSFLEKYWFSFNCILLKRSKTRNMISQQFQVFMLKIYILGNWLNNDNAVFYRNQSR